MALPFRKPGQGSGGYLDGSTVRLVDYAFVINKEGETAKGNPFKNYSVKLTVQPDGADAVDQFLDAGTLWGNNTVSKDGKSIIGSDRYSLDTDTPWGAFAVTLVEGEGLRIPEEMMHPELRDYKGVMGARVVLSRKVDVEATIERGRYLIAKAKGKAAGENATREAAIEAGKKTAKKGKNAGKAFMLDKLTVAEVVELPDGKANKATKATTAKADKKAPAQTEPAAAAADTDAVDAALRAILAGSKDQTLARTAISGAVVKYRLAAKLSADEGEAIRKQLISDAYIADAVNRGVIVSDGEGKAATITLVPTE